jgi:hypothetical protein
MPANRTCNLPIRPECPEEKIKYTCLIWSAPEDGCCSKSDQSTVDNVQGSQSPSKTP